MTKSFRIWLIMLVLFIAAASRARYLADWAHLAGDELWAAWRSSGTPAEIIRWTPYDWPPGSFLVLGAWQWLVGAHPVALRVLPWLAGMLGLAGLYALARRLFGPRAALLALGVGAAGAYALFNGVFLRGHSLITAGLPFLLLATVAYFKSVTQSRTDGVPQRGTLRYGVLLGVLLAVYLYLHATTVLLFAAIGLVTLMVWPRRVWHWWLPVLVMGVLAAPELYSKAVLAAGRVDGGGAAGWPSFVAAVGGLYRDFVGAWWPAWVAVGVLAVAGAVLGARRVNGTVAVPTGNEVGRAYPVAEPHRLALAFGLWALAPVAFWLANPALNLLAPRYMAWAFTGAALALGVALARLPRPLTAALVPVLAALSFVPVNRVEYEWVNPRVGETLAYLRDHALWGDVLVIDPLWRGSMCASATVQDCQSDEFWDYYTRAYFPNGLTVTNTVPPGARRVWYAHFAGRSDPNTQAAVQAGRVPRGFVGPTAFFTQLYEAPPDAVGVPLANGMRYHGADVLDVVTGQPETTFLHVRRKGQDVRVRVWWSVDAPPTLDYSTGVFLLRAGATADQHDGAPALVYPPESAALPTSQWVPGTFYIEERTVTLPIIPGTGTNPFDVRVTAYQWWDGARVPADGFADGLLPAATVNLRLW